MTVYIAIFVVGLVALYTFARTDAFARITGQSTTSQLNNVQAVFFRTVFTLLGYVAKRDGPVNDKEVKRTEVFMEKMDLDSTHKREAIRLFKSGADPAFNVQKTLDGFKGIAKKSPNLAQILLVYLINLARVDGALVNKEIEAVEEVAFGLGYSNITFKHLLRMISSQNTFAKNVEEEVKNKTQAKKEHHNTQRAGAENNRAESANKNTNVNNDQRPQQDDDESCAEKTRDFQSGTVNLNSAYDVLDVAPSASDAEVKKAYRTLVNQYHPDKLIGLGLPPYMVQAATECFKTIQSAYDYIRKARAK